MFRPLWLLRPRPSAAAPPRVWSVCGNSSSDLFRHQQVRYKRHDGNKAFTRNKIENRPPTKKQRKIYGRQLKQQHQQQTQHVGKHMSKANVRQEWFENEMEHVQISKNALEPTEIPYDAGDALLDDLMGHAKPGAPTPKPVYLGNKYQAYYTRLNDRMQAYHVQNGNALEQPVVQLPTDAQIATLVRSFRDKHGTYSNSQKQKHSPKEPVGIVSVLQLLIQDLRIPVSCWGERTFNAILSCARTPQEGRRILTMMRQQPSKLVSVYTWCILLEIHAKIGDYQGCVQIMQEMMQADNIAPPLAAFTSTMAACYRILMDTGRVPHSVRADAGEVAWRKWQEMRIVGIEADAMAYGAILRVCAARGQAEKAINLLEEMDQFQVLPTTLCFTAALRAVAKSHAVAIRYENGASLAQNKRAFLTQHHGNMALDILRKAESAQVVQDQGFIAALMSCAAVAGDLATAKAVYVAHQIRRLDQFRTIGSESHLRRLSGENHLHRSPDLHQSRHLVPVAAEHGVEDSLEGLDNLQDPPRDGSSSYKPFGIRKYGRDSRVLTSLLHACAVAVDPNGIGTMWGGRENLGILHQDSLRLLNAHRQPRYEDKTIPGLTHREITQSSLKADEEVWEDDYRENKRKPRKYRGMEADERAGYDRDTIAPMFSRMYEDEEGRLREEYRATTPEDIWLQRYPNDETLSQVQAARDGCFPIHETSSSSTLLLSTQTTESSEHENLDEKLVFDMETRTWRVEARKQEKESVDISSAVDGLASDDVAAASAFGKIDVPALGGGSSTMPLLLRKTEAVDSVASVGTKHGSALIAAETKLDDSWSNDLSNLFSDHVQVVSDDDIHKMEADLAELREILPYFSEARLRRILRAFSSTLGDVSLVQLVPLVRERMPDFVTNTWLKQMSSITAQHALQKAEEDELVDVHVLNNILELEAVAGNLDKALEFHGTQFQQRGIKPTPYSDRLVVQMFLRNKRLSRALAFKGQVEKHRSLDLHAYGSLVDYCSQREQIGSAMTFLKECMSVHGGAFPNESSLARLRQRCRQTGIMREIGLEALIGPDPLEWLRDGESNLKRNKSTQGRHEVQLARNILLQA
jgi:pentatricopeptide repeat protein